jgi:hypothetical protein
MNIDKIFRPVLTALIFTFFIASGIFASGISISTEVTRTSIPFESRDTLIVELTWEGEPYLYQIDDFPIPSLEKLQILGSSSSVSTMSDSTVASGEKTVRTYRFILEPTDFGTGIIEPLSINATNRLTDESHQLQTGRLTIEIAKPIPGDDDSASSGLLIIAVIAVVVVAAAIFIILVVIRGKRSEPEADPAMEYLRTLEEIKKETVADGKLFYSRLYRLLLLYLEKERGINLSGRTGEEVLREASKLDDEFERDRVAGWLDKALKVKFRPDMPSSRDIEDSYNAVRQFFENKLQNK